MSSPAKRRKTTKDDTPSRPTRNLDFFFGLSPCSLNLRVLLTEQKASKQEQPPSSPPQSHDEFKTAEELSDEQLARQLQEQFDREEQANAAPAPAPASQEDLYTVDEEKGNANLPQESADSAAQPTQEHTLSLQAATAIEDTVTPIVNFDQSPLTFDPSEYIPALKKQWQAESATGATYALLTHCFVLVNTTQSRIKIVDNLVNCLRLLIEADPSSLLPMVWLTVNSISPSYIDLELGLGGSAISKALKKVCGLDGQGLKTLYNKYGDAGDVAFEAKKKQSLTLRKPKPLTIAGVYDSLVRIASSKGHGSQDAKQRIVEKLVQDARGAEESRYVVRTLVQHLRIGAVKTTMLIALSRAFLLSRPAGADFAVRDRKELARLKKEQLAEVWARSEETVKACFAKRPNYNDLVPALLSVGVCAELQAVCGLALHIPLRPMLGNITRDLGEMLTKLQGRDFSCEFKYDGQRAQVHCDPQGRVTIFSRHLEVMTEKYPDLVALVPQIAGEGVSSFIMEGEVVAIDHVSGELKTFQTLANRAKKDVDIGAVTIGVCLFAFDLMYLNGEPLLDRPFRERRELLRSLFVEVPNRFTWVRSLDATSEDSETVLDFFKQATDYKCEGIMVKVLDNQINPALAQVDDVASVAAPTSAPPAKTKKGTRSKTKGPADDPDAAPSSRRKALLSTYEPDKRIDSWLKVKKDYATSSDTLDLVPIGAWHGQGRKSAWWSPVLLAARNPSTGALEAVTKCMSGFTDAFYKAMRKRYDPGGPNTRASRAPGVEYPFEPDVWFEPAEVWEIAYADITISPTYPAALGMVSETRGLSTRFPRFLKTREDKSIEEATTCEYLAKLWRNQEARAANDSSGLASKSAGAAAAADDGELLDYVDDE